MLAILTPPMAPRSFVDYFHRLTVLGLVGIAVRSCTPGHANTGMGSLADRRRVREPHWPHGTCTSRLGLYSRQFPLGDPNRETLTDVVCILCLAELTQAKRLFSKKDEASSAETTPEPNDKKV